MTFVLIMKEKYPSEMYPCYRDLNPDREVVYIIYEITYDQYRNEWKRILFKTENLDEAKKLLRSCRLTQGIEIKDE